MVNEVLTQLSGLAAALAAEVHASREASAEARANGDAVTAFQCEVSVIKARRLQREIEQLVQRHSEHLLVPTTAKGKVHVRGIVTATH